MKEKVPKSTQNVCPKATTDKRTKIQKHSQQPASLTKKSKFLTVKRREFNVKKAYCSH